MPSMIVRMIELLALPFALTAMGVPLAHAADCGAATGRGAVLTIPLWPAGLPAGGGHAPKAPQHVAGRTATDPGVIKDVGSPYMEVYRPAVPGRTAVLVLGGGAYEGIAIDQESLPTARWMTSLGVTAAVLYYRLPGDGWAPVAPFQDAQRAMRILRGCAARLGIDPRSIGVVGFSAGGNLAGIIATHFDHDFYTPEWAGQVPSSRPDFAALIYPVSSLARDSSGTARALAAQKDADAAYAIQKHVSKSTPPVFIVQQENDPVVDVSTNLALFDVLRKHGVPAELHLFEGDQHGFGLGQPGTRAARWPCLFADWLAYHGWLRGAAWEAERCR